MNNSSMIQYTENDHLTFSLSTCLRAGEQLRVHVSLSFGSK
jgi:hypothetical protein